MIDDPVVVMVVLIVEQRTHDRRHGRATDRCRVERLDGGVVVRLPVLALVRRAPTGLVIVVFGRVIVDVTVIDRLHSYPVMKIPS